MTTETTVRQPDTPLADLTPGTYIHWRDERGIQPIQVARLLHVERYQGARPMVAALVERPGGPELLRKTADHMVVVATPEDIAAAGEGERRAAVVAALRELADDIEDLALPVPRYGLNVSAAVWTYAEAEAWAEYLGVEVRAGGPQKDIPVADREGDALAVHVQSQEPMPAAEPVSADLSHAGVDRILAALAAEGIEVHYSETDGDTAIDIWLTDVELADGMPATALSWRDAEGWLLRHWAAFGGDTNTQAPDEKWPISAGGPAEVARDVAAILDESATADAQAGA